MTRENRLRLSEDRFAVVYRLTGGEAVAKANQKTVASLRDLLRLYDDPLNAYASVT